MHPDLQSSGSLIDQESIHLSMCLHSQPVNLAACANDCVNQYVQQVSAPRHSALCLPWSGMSWQKRIQHRQRAIGVRASASDPRRQISDLVKSDLYSKYLQRAVFIGVLAAGDDEYIRSCCPHRCACFSKSLTLQQCHTSFCKHVLRHHRACACAAVDAGYSGDWSRIGAISKDAEEALKQALPLLGAFHVFCAAVSGCTANRAGRPWQWPAPKAR